ncbi:protein of unknown function DUF1929 [Kalmanozyma brasiliensis GHG001]|uniref:Putative Glo1-Glyoxaloxidase 1 n=1 Tax=Kalmanozyma brasiliensis (strain GHG001) TaxID=1365824 RepID=V5E6N1_KALBG|nr:protein of unknown function DUF1929 [Kalmanozyma brasiliensis GHG001]EST05926.1 protein of unknown function DUF1929 [Kalmanozyma brasiliensis GHG001]
MTKQRSTSSRRSSSLAAKVMTFATAALALSSHASAANKAGTFEIVNTNSLASAMMLGVIDEDTVFILDKAENNSARLADGRPVWGSYYKLSDNSVTGTAVQTNTFCAAGATMGNGSWLVAGGNQAVGYGGASQAQNLNPYQDYDGTRAIRLLEPGSDTWIDSPSTSITQVNMLQSARWYPGIETLEDGSVIFIGGAVSGGYINRNTPTTDTLYQNGGANPTYEYFPAKTVGNLPISQFMSKTNGLNMYAHTYLMPSGKIFMQANTSAILWDHYNNIETTLPEMPGGVVRVYPASGAVAMLPLTPQNSYTPTVLFCGGSVMSDTFWGNYSGPGGNILGVTASADCSSITPEDHQGNQTPNMQYVQEETLPQGRSMGQFIHLPDGTMVIVNGANKGTAGYTNATYNTIQYQGQTVVTEGLSQDPTYVPVLYDPSKPKGQRLSNTGFQPSTIARLYHSTAVLLSDGSVMIAGSNPHQDVSLNMPTGTTPQAFNTTYEIEKWYPPYWDQPRPYPQGMPSSVLYGGNPFNITVNGTFMGDSANAKAANTKFAIIRTGFSTHAMNMGQRAVYLDYTYTVNEDASVTYMVNPLPNTIAMNRLLVPGPAYFFVTVGGVPSYGKMISVGTAALGGVVPTQYNLGSALVSLPAAVNSTKFTASISRAGSSTSEFGLGKIIGIAVAGAAVLALIALGCCLWRRKGKRNGEKAATGGAAAPWSNTRDLGSGGPEYKRVETPVGSVAGGRFAGARMDSSNTFESYRMSDQISESKDGYYDHSRSGSRAGYAPSPLAYDQYGRASAQGSYQQQGWGEYHAGDAGAYYEDNPQRYGSGGGSAGRGGGRSYDYPPEQQQHYSQQQQYSQQSQRQYYDSPRHQHSGSYSSRR